MKKNRKAQNALEFMLILIFMLIFVSLVMYLIGLYTMDLNKQKAEDELNDFADSILSEVTILQKVEGKYTRVINFTKSDLEYFNISINNSFLIIEDFKFEGTENNKNYYYIPGEYPVTYYYNETTETGFLTFTKPTQDDYDGIILEEK